MNPLGLGSSHSLCYQRVDVRLADGHDIQDVPVFNAEEIELPEKFAGVRIEDLHLHTA